MKKLLIALIIVGIGVAGLYLMFNSSKSISSIQEDAVGIRSESSSQFFVPAQNGSGNAMVDQVIMNEPGFIVIREVINDRPGQIIEVSNFLTGGVHTNISIGLGGVQDTGDTPSGSELVAVVYADDGDGGFNPFLDTPMYVDGQLLARYVRTGEIASETVAIPNTVPGKNKVISATVIYTDEGFSPEIATIERGEAVEFVNKSNRLMWVASDVHPAHTILPTFDQFGTLVFGESYQYTFDDAGDWKYHDHVNANKIGTIIVK